MKPVTLKIEGLNSFLERQEIDFTSLSEGGVFGIFGPTGSGKSSILDAITLALFGKVERAARGTQGIINNSADKVNVDFTFEIGVGSARKQYRVIRVYRRAGESGAHNTQSRLTELTLEGEITLADKDKDVSKAIIDIIGLNDDDFTRAVVLPQGKFSEFLNLEGAKRSKMLQRLFNLEVYGSRLNEKIKRQLGEAATEQAAVEGELQGMGDASPEALLVLQDALKEAEAVRGRAAVTREETRKKFEVWKEVWNNQKEIQSLKEQAAQMELERPDIDIKTTRLEGAKRAALVRPYLEGALQAAEASKALVIRRDHLLTLAEESRAALEAAKQNYNLARDQRKEAEPSLLAEKERYSRALDLEKELTELHKKAKQGSNELTNIKAEEDSLSEVVATGQQARKSLEENISLIKNEIISLTVDPSYRAKVANALVLYREWKAAEKDCLEKEAEHKSIEAVLTNCSLEQENASSDLAQIRQKVAAAEGDLENQKNTPPFTEERILELQQGLERGRGSIAEVERCEAEVQKAWEEQGKAVLVYEDLCRKEAEGAAAFHQVEASREQGSVLLKEREEKLKELEGRNLAALLARGLTIGEACPVCGSTHHPEPSVSVEENLWEEAKSLCEEAREFFRSLEEQYRLASGEHAKFQAQKDGALEILRKTEALLNYAQENLKKARSAFTNEKLREMNVPELKGYLEGFRNKLEHAVKVRQEWLGQMDKAQKEQEGLKVSLSQAEMKLARAEATLKKSREDLASADDKWAKSREAKLEKEALLLEAKRGLADREPLDEEKEISRKDQETAKLTGKLSDLEKGLSEHNREINKIEEDLQSLSSNRLKLEAAFQALDGQLKEKQSQLVAITGGREAGHLLEEIAAGLAALAEAEDKYQSALEEARTRQSETEKEKSALEALVKEAMERQDQTAAALGQELAEHGFESPGEADRAWHTAEERSKLEAEINAFKSKSQELAGIIKGLENKLSGRVISPEQWLSWQDKLTQAEDKYDQASNEVGIAQSNLAKLEENHTRWVALAEQRNKLNQLINSLEQLRKVFKGDAFVEFIAREQMDNVALAASQRLKQMTGHRYALELDAEGGFIMRDDANGGVKRGVSTLSGGETFLTSLALALALSSQIQLKGKYPLEFFFLDEGFGTLDSELLDKVMSTLEGLPTEKMVIGVISHVPELRQRMARRLVVEPAQPGTSGSRVRFELA